MTHLDKLKAAYDPEDFRNQGHELIDILADYLASVSQGNGPVLPDLQPEELEEKYSTIFRENGSLLSLIREVLKDSNHIHHPGYMGHQVCPPVPVSTLSALAGTLLNNGSAVYEMGMANVAMERVIVKKVAEHAGFPSGADGILTSGGSLGNLTAILAARQIMMESDTWSEGYPDEVKPVFLVSSQTHYSLEKATRILGLGSEGCEAVPCDDHYRMDTTRLPETIEAINNSGRKVIGVIASAGSTATGAYDQLPEIAHKCRDYGLWLHVDGAHGAPALFSSKYRNLIKGIELADSLVIDFHKMVMTPALNTAVIFRNGDHSYQTFAQKASYLFTRENEKEWFQFASRTVECTKSMMGLNVFSILRTHGLELIDANVTWLFDLTKEFYQLLESYPEIERIHEPEGNILVFRYIDATLSSSELNRLNKGIRDAVLQAGNYYIVQTQLNGSWYLRVTIMNPFSTVESFEELVKEIIGYAKSDQG